MYEQSAAAIGRAAAVAAETNGPDAAWFNPAGLAFAPARGASLSIAAVAGSTRFSPQAPGPTVRSRSDVNVVPSLFTHAALTKRVQLGLALLAPFGFALRWPDGWVGAERALETQIVVLALNPSVAVRLGDHVSLAAGVSVLYGTVTLSAALPADVGGTGELVGGATGVAGNLALLVRPLPDVLHLAATFRSSSKLAFEGDADFSAQNAAAALTFADQRATADITLPDVITVAAMARPHPEWTFTADVNQVRWSRFDRLLIAFEQPTTPNRLIARGNRDPFTFRGGVEWAPQTWPALRARAGASYDQSAVAARTLAPAAPDADRLSLATGLGYTWPLSAVGSALTPSVTIDLAYLYAHFLDARTSGEEGPAGTYRARGHGLALTVTLR